MKIFLIKKKRQGSLILSLSRNLESKNFIMEDASANQRKEKRTKEKLLLKPSSAPKDHPLCPG